MAGILFLLKAKRLKISPQHQQRRSLAFPNTAGGNVRMPVVYDK
jgi:hypothetical protein